MKQLIKDDFFKVWIDLDGSSPAPDRSIWRAQHTCKSEEDAAGACLPLDPAAAIIKHELNVKHWSVLNFGFVVMHFEGFPHDTVMQMCRHQDSSFLVQSLRYTGDRYKTCNPGNVHELFYSQPPGIYGSRGGSYEVTEQDYWYAMNSCLTSADNYNTAIRMWQPEESARRLLAAGYRQNFCMAGTIEAVFHWLDQRTLADSQIECQTLAWMALDELKKWSPGLFGWYRQNRAGRAILAPS